MKTTIPFILALVLTSACSEPEKPTISLYLAMQRGDIEQIERHVHWGTDLNQLDRDGFTPLQVAVRKGRIAITRLLLKQGVAVDQPDHEGHTALYHAVLGGRTRIADLLLKAGAKIEPTPWLIEAAKQNISGRETIEYLVKHGAETEARNSSGDTPLLIAIRHANHKLAKHLVNFGADVTVADIRGNSALSIANSMGLSDIALLLRRNGAT